MKIKKLLMFICFCSTFFSAIKIPSQSVYVEKKEKLAHNFITDESIKDATSEEEINLSKKQFYQFVSNDITYYVADDFQDESKAKVLIRTMDDFSEYPYFKTVTFDLSKRIIEFQKYIPDTNEFKKKFCYISNCLYNQIKSNSFLIDNGRDVKIYNCILDSFQYEIDYAKSFYSYTNHSSILKSSPGKVSHVLDTDNQANLDLFINNQKNKHKNALTVNYTQRATIDDEITLLIPKKYFSISTTRQIYGTEWGFYMDTYPYGVSQYLSQIFIFDIETTPVNKTNAEIFTVTPILNASYIYDSNTDIVSYLQDNTFGITNALYMSNITYVSDYIETFNDYDELEYVPINEHPLNPNDKRYIPNEDLGLFFSQYGVYAKQKTDIDFQTCLLNFSVNALTAVLLDLIPNNLVSFAIGKTIDGIGLLSKKIIEQINSKSVISEEKETASCKIEENGINKTITYYKETNAYNPDENETVDDFHKFISFDFRKQPNLFLTDKEDSISFYAYIVHSKDIDDSYKGLISHCFNFDLAKGTASNHQTICSFSNNIGYTYQPCYQTKDMSISTPIGFEEEHVLQLGLDNSQNFELKFTAPENRKYLFSFFNLPNSTKITFEGEQTFDSGKITTKKFPSVKGFSGPDFIESISNSYQKEIYLEKNKIISIKVNNFDQPKKDLKYYYSQFSMFVYQLNDPITHFTDVQSVLDETYGEYIAKTSYQTISFQPKISGLYTLSMYNDTGSSRFLITDEKSRTLYKMYSNDSERSVILNLTGNSKYYIHYCSNRNNQNVKFFIDKCRYLPSKLVKNDMDYSYIKKNIEYTFIFNPYEDTKAQFSLQPYSVYATANVYDYQHRLLQSPSPSFSFTFSANKIYYIQIKFKIYDNTIINTAFLRVKGM